MAASDVVITDRDHDANQLHINMTVPGGYGSSVRVILHWVLAAHVTAAYNSSSSSYSVHLGAPFHYPLPEITPATLKMAELSITESNGSSYVIIETEDTASFINFKGDFGVYSDEISVKLVHEEHSSLFIDCVPFDVNSPNNLDKPDKPDKPDNPDNPSNILMNLNYHSISVSIGTCC